MFPQSTYCWTYCTYLTDKFIPMLGSSGGEGSGLSAVTTLLSNNATTALSANATTATNANATTEVDINATTTLYGNATTVEDTNTTMDWTTTPLLSTSTTATTVTTTRSTTERVTKEGIGNCIQSIFNPQSFFTFLFTFQILNITFLIKNI